MKTFFPLITLTLLIVNFLSAQSITQQEAQTLAGRFVSAQFQVKNVELMPCQMGEMSKDKPQMYFFNLPEKGFVIISAEKSTMPILAYSYDGKLSNKKASPAFINWIENLKNQVDYCRQTKASATEDISNFWKQLEDNNISNWLNTKSKDVAPLIRCSWDQSGFYNDHCPSNSDGQAVVGCVALSMAQVMYYWRYPQTGSGTHSYYATDFGTQSANFGTSTYEWSHMQNSISEYNKEIAEICYHCGVSVDMGYGVDASGAYTYNVPSALETYFKYNSAANYQSKNSTSSTTWKNNIISNIDAKRPLIYSGSGDQGGHAFNLDGYQGTDYFHFNFGWAGYGDGYYYLDAINPVSNDFTNSQAAVFNIYPNSAVTGCSGTTTIPYTFGSIEDGSGPAANATANADCRWLISPEQVCDYIKITFQELNLTAGDSVIIYKGNSTSASRHGAYSGSSLPAATNVSSSEVLVQFITNDNTPSGGFLLNFEGHSIAYCSGITTLTDPQGTITDGSASENYGNNAMCRWVISIPNATLIHLDFTEMDIQPDYDYVKVINSVTNETLLETSGSSIPNNMDIASNKVTIWFKTDASYTGQGFSLNYSSVIDGVLDDENKKVLVYPNPAHSFLGIELSDSEGAVAELIDLNGKIIFTSELCNQKNMLNIANIAKGIYQLRIKSVSLDYQTKILLQ